MPLSFRSLRQSAAVLPLPARRWRKSASSSPKSGTPSLFAPMKSARPGGARPSQTKETSSAMAGPLNPASAIVVVAGPLGASPSEGSPLRRVESTRIGKARASSASRSISAPVMLSAQWMSSKTRSCGRRDASAQRSLTAAPITCSRYLAPEMSEVSRWAEVFGDFAAANAARTRAASASTGIPRDASSAPSAAAFRSARASLPTSASRKVKKGCSGRLLRRSWHWITRSSPPPSRLTSRRSSETRRDLPIPASPTTHTDWPAPARAFAQARCSRASWAPRPCKGAFAPRTAANRSTTVRGRSGRQSCTGSLKPLRLAVPSAR